MSSYPSSSDSVQVGSMSHVPGATLHWESAPEEWFTGRVWFGAMAPPGTPEARNVLGVSFSPGARTAWHKHIEGQVLYFVHGAGLVVNDAGDRVEASAGDAVVVQPGEVHWHGATEHSHAMHLSITTGGATEWLGRKVTDAEYHGSD